jgi:hypothetical protein
VSGDHILSRQVGETERKWPPESSHVVPNQQATEQPISDWRPVQPIRIQERGSNRPIRNGGHITDQPTLLEDSKQTELDLRTDSDMPGINQQQGMLYRNEGRDRSSLFENNDGELSSNMKTSKAKTRLQGRIVQRGGNRVTGMSYG